MSPDVSVIIVNYHTSDLIKNCVESILEKTTGISYQVIIVDNNSEPDLEEKTGRVIPAQFKGNFNFVALPENIGFGRANNEGLKIAKGRNIFFLNPDTLLINNAIKILSDFLDSHPKAGACGGNLYNEEMRPAMSFKRILPGILWETDELLNNIPLKILYGKNQMHNFTGKAIKTGFITGADLMVKREVLDQTGSFSPDFFMYFEETDLCNRIKKSGREIYSVPEAKIRHLESKSFSATDAFQSEFKTRLMEESRGIYYKRNKGALERIVSDFIYGMFLQSRALLIKDKRKKDYYRLRLKSRK